MDAKTFIRMRGTKVSRQVAEAAGTSYAYLSQIAHGHRRPSVEMANRLVEASGGEMDFVSLMQAKKGAA